MAKKRRGTKKEREARKKLLDEPWWKMLDIEFVISMIAVTAVDNWIHCCKLVGMFEHKYVESNSGLIT